VLEIQNIKKIYPSNRGLHQLSLVIEPGETVALVGPNGSGKSTSLNIIAGILKSNTGMCRINGLDTLQTETKKHIGFLEESPFFYSNSTVVGFLNFIWLVKYPDTENGDIFRLLDKFELTAYKTTKIKELSKGLRQRIGIISALMNSPPLIVLDEPTNGLDTWGVLCLKDELLAIRDKGCIVVLSNHILDFVKDVCSRIIFLKDGYVQKDLCNNAAVNLDEVYRRVYSPQ